MDTTTTTSTAEAYARRELPLYLGHKDPIGTVSADIIYQEGAEAGTLALLQALVHAYEDELKTRRGIARKLADWWYPRTPRWKRLENLVNDQLVARLQTTDVRIASTRRLTTRQELIARIEYLRELLERARYRTWKMPEDNK